MVVSGSRSHAIQGEGTMTEQPGQTEKPRRRSRVGFSRLKLFATRSLATVVVRAAIRWAERSIRVR
jgi:hypothetical protein